MQAMSGFWLLLMIAMSILVKANSQCGEDETRNSEVSQPCNQIYAALESALVSTDNLYVLRTVLYPTSDRSPTLLEVEYDLQLPDNGTFITTLGWTDSGVFAAINPETLFNLQLRILYWPLRNLVLEPDTITLTLDARDSEVLSNVTTSDIADVLDILNARLLVYATMQEALTDWDGTDIGYTWEVKNGNDGLLIGVVIVTTPIAVVIFFALFSALRGVLDESDSISVLKFLYGLEVPALILIFVEFVTSFIQWVECQSFACIVKEYTVIAVFIFAILFTAYSIMFTTEKTCNFNFLHLFLSNFVFLKAFISLTSISSVPLILLIIVYPAEILCTIIIYLSAITLLAVFLSPLSVYSATRHRSSLDIPDLHQNNRGNEDTDFGESTQNADLIPRQKISIWKQKWEALTAIVEKHRTTLIVLAVFFNASLAAMLLCLLYMQALLAGATSNVVVNFVLIVITALIPGGLVYGTSKAIRKRFHPGEQVALINKNGELTPGQYTVISKVDKENYLVRNNGTEGVVNGNVLLNEKETPRKAMGFCMKKSVNPGDRVILKTSNKQWGLRNGQYEVIARVSEESSSYLIKNSLDEQGIVDVTDLIKIRFHPGDQVFLIIAHEREKLSPGRYTVVRDVMVGDELRYQIRNDTGEGVVEVDDLLSKTPQEVSHFLSQKPSTLPRTRDRQANEVASTSSAASTSTPQLQEILPPTASQPKETSVTMENPSPTPSPHP